MTINHQPEHPSPTTCRPTVTIGLPFYNARETLLDAVRSVFAQTFADWELILVDDGSTDGGAELVRGICDPRLCLLSDGTNRGLAARLNQIADRANGGYLARMDADDMMFPERLAAQIEHLTEHDDCDLLGTGIVCTDRVGGPVALRTAPERVDDPGRILAGEVLFHPTVLGRTEWFRHHRYDEALRLSEDFDLWARSADRLRICNLQQPLLFYREYGSFAYAKYRRQSCVTRDVLRREGPRLVGPVHTRRLLVRRRLKDAVCAALAVAGGWRLALALHNRRLAPAEPARYRTLVAHVQATPLPPHNP